MSHIDPTVVRRIILQQSKKSQRGPYRFLPLRSRHPLRPVRRRTMRRLSGRRRPRPGDSPKGHAGLALYAVLSQRGWIEVTLLDFFCGNDSAFGVHPEAAVPGVDFSTGSLGQGVCFAAGAALAARMQRSHRRGRPVC